jgi:PRC-barrel domain
MSQLEAVDLNNARAWPGLEVFDREGERVGRLTGIYVDAESSQPEFGLVRTGLFGLRSLLVPLSGAFVEGGALIVDLEKRAIKGSPHLRRDEPMPAEMEDPLYRHYGMEPRPTVDGRPRLSLWEPDSSR